MVHFLDTILTPYVGRRPTNHETDPTSWLYYATVQYCAARFDYSITVSIDWHSID